MPLRVVCILEGVIWTFAYQPRIFSCNHLCKCLCRQRPRLCMRDLMHAPPHRSCRDWIWRRTTRPNLDLSTCAPSAVGGEQGRAQMTLAKRLEHASLVCATSAPCELRVPEPHDGRAWHQLGPGARYAEGVESTQLLQWQRCVCSKGASHTLMLYAQTLLLQADQHCFCCA